MNNQESEMPNQRGLLKPTLQITFFSILGVLVSFITQIIVAAKFGATMERDAYFAAVVVPGYVAVVLLGSLTVTFVPIFIEYETKKSKAEAWIVASIFTNLTFLVLFGISLLGFIFAKGLISITAPGFEGVTLSLTVALLRIILPSIIFSGLTSLLSSMYYAEHRFVRPAIVPVVSAVLMLLSVVFLARYWGIKSLAFGYLISGVLSFLILVPILFKQGRYSFSFDFSNEGVRQVIRVMAPLVLAGLFYRATTVIERMIASTLQTGSISYLGYATRIISILVGIATFGITTTIFPVMARGWVENDLTKVREYFTKGIRITMLSMFPIAMVFAVLRVPIIRMLFERGAFDHQTTIAVANTILILLVGPFICGGLGNIVGRWFYISQKTKLVAVLSFVRIVIYLSIAYLLSKRLSYIGLAMATSIQFVLGLIISLYLVKRIFNGLNGARVLEGFVKVLISSLLGGVCIHYLFEILTSKCNLILRNVIAGASGILVYGFFVTYIFRLSESVNLKEKVLKKLRVFIRKGTIEN